MGRRVYLLDEPLLARIAGFQARVGARCEVDAVRHLLRAGLDSMDTPEDLVARHSAGEPATIFAGHHLVKVIEQDDGRLVAVTFRNGGVYRPKQERA